MSEFRRHSRKGFFIYMLRPVLDTRLFSTATSVTVSCQSFAHLFSDSPQVSQILALPRLSARAPVATISASRPSHSEWLWRWARSVHWVPCDVHVQASTHRTWLCFWVSDPRDPLDSGEHIWVFVLQRYEREALVPRVGDSRSRSRSPARRADYD